MQVEPWRMLQDYADGKRSDLTRMLSEDAGVYLIARPCDPSRVVIRDIVYIGLAGEAPNARGTFKQRIWSHTTKLTKGVQGTAGSLPCWRAYHSIYGGPNALEAHALRLIRMSASSLAEKRLIGEREDLLLLLWSQFGSSPVQQMPVLNTKRPDRNAILGLFEGAIESLSEASSISGATEVAESPATIESLSDLRESDDEGLEQDQRLAQFESFFASRGLLETWNELSSTALQHGHVFRAIGLGARGDRPGQLRLSRIRPGARRASDVLAIVSPHLSGRNARVTLRWPPERLPSRFRGIARGCLAADGRSRCSSLTVPLVDLNGLMIEVTRLADEPRSGHSAIHS